MFIHLTLQLVNEYITDYTIQKLCVYFNDKTRKRLYTVKIINKFRRKEGLNINDFQNKPGNVVFPLFEEISTNRRVYLYPVRIQYNGGWCYLSEIFIGWDAR